METQADLREAEQRFAERERAFWRSEESANYRARFERACALALEEGKRIVEANRRANVERPRPRSGAKAFEGVKYGKANRQE